ncbi:Bifunctional acetohydroxyacid reductoisomerase [Tulasnella sp. 427]|nr:Bifunctional acetohydroxyacid reductoisomerase [Tulasnella sp. 427]
MSAVARSARSALRTVARSAVAPSPAVAVASRSYSLLARAATAAPKVSQAQWARGVKTLDFAGTKEVVYERADWPLPKLQEYFKNDTLALIGYGSQGHGQGLNARDNGLNVIVGVREGGESWKLAQEDGWVPGETLFPIEEAIKRGSIVMNLLSDAAQSATWSELAPLITKGKTLYFSHGFSVVFKDDTKVVPPSDVDVILVAPKGSGRTVRTLFKEGRGINSSIAVWQDVTGKAKEKAIALGIAVGSGYLYETTFEKEVYSDLYGERGVLMGGIQGMFKAQYEVLRANGHSPSEAFNETVEEATQSLFPLIGQYGMDYMYAACSTTARRGALDWAPIFEKANKPVFEALYKSVRDGTETRKSLQPPFLLPKTPSNPVPSACLVRIEPVGHLLASDDDDQQMTELPPEITVEEFLQSFAIRRSRNAKTYKRKRGSKQQTNAVHADSAIAEDGSDPIVADTPHRSPGELTRKTKHSRMRRAGSTTNSAYHGTRSLPQRLTRVSARSASDHHNSGDSQELEFVPASTEPQFRPGRQEMWRRVDPRARVAFPAPFFAASVPATKSPRKPLSHWLTAVSEREEPHAEYSVIAPETPVDYPQSHRKRTCQVAAGLPPESAVLSFVPMDEHELQLQRLRSGTAKHSK